MAHLKRWNCDGKLYNDATVGNIVSMVNVACADKDATSSSGLRGVYYHLLTHLEGPIKGELKVLNNTFLQKLFFQPAWDMINQNGDDDDDQHTTKLYATIRCWQLLRDHDELVSAARTYCDAARMYNEWKTDCYGDDFDDDDD